MAGIQERIKTVQKQYGIEDSEFEGVLTATAQPKNQTQVAPETDYLSKKDFTEAGAKLAAQLPRVAAKMMKLSREHSKLYPDQDFDPDAVLDLCRKESITLDQAAARLYKYDERREELYSRCYCDFSVFSSLSHSKSSICRTRRIGRRNRNSIE